MKKNKERIDNFLTKKGYFETKSKAQSAIMAGKVKINGEKITKSGTQIDFNEDYNIEIEKMPYVSRGGFKLEKALQAFDIDINNQICLDAGASTGGFTDCMLQKGAKKVYAIDVGYGQIAWKLRQDDRVIVIERTNIRNCSIKDVYSDTKVDDFAKIAVMDLSFISITKVLNNIKMLMNPANQTVISLIKPQFEAGKEQVPKTGVIKDKQVHFDVIKNVIEYAKTIKLYPINLTYSPIKGPAGNIEYLVHLENSECSLDDNFIKKIVDDANEKLSD
ncbi:MAG: TlyA family RNA methyltransferase [Candidatus Gastranaerophilales bacterium]|nr:TlyA family RNA methyltransferase [Candidatus Gastranaerophilales bacterium]